MKVNIIKRYELRLTVGFKSVGFYVPFLVFFSKLMKTNAVS